eukprot:6210931-Pleurochrysis_carterae.AAC.2
MDMAQKNKISHRAKASETPPHSTMRRALPPSAREPPRRTTGERETHGICFLFSKSSAKGRLRLCQCASVWSSFA